ncbi:MAG: hypothetical protein ABJN62_02105 [Halioglobus sp.]
MKHSHHTFTGGKALCFAAAMTLFQSAAQAQVPEITISGLPAEPLIGETFCTTVSLTNSAVPTGYGPYLVAVVEEGVSEITIDFVDIEPVLEEIGTFDATGQLIDPISGETITGPEDANAYNVIYPVGAVEQSTPALDMEFCGVVAIGTEPNVPLVVEFIPGFEFGDTATGDNGAILGTQQDSTVTPRLARITKTNSAPENERPPGPSHAFNYRYVMDISAGVKLDEILLTDILPPEIQWTGGNIGINAPLGAGCSATGLPNFPPVPSGTITVECITAVGTSGTDDLVVTLPVYITDILDESIDDSKLIINTVDADYKYQDDDFADSDISEVVAVHAAAQKTVSGGDRPGQTLTYTIGFQLTDYPDDVTGAGATTFILVDNLPDGLQYTTTVDLEVNGTNYPITPSVDLNPSTGVTTLIWDIAAAVDSSGSPLLPNAVEGVLRYRTLILDEYVNPAGPVQAGDRLSNDVSLAYDLSEGASGDDSSGDTAGIVENITDKELTDPPPGSFDTIMPGAPVTFTLTKEIPAGSTSNVIIEDFLPRPVFDVSEAPAPVVNVIQGPAVTPTINTAANSVVLNYGDIVSNTATTIEVQLIATVTTEPFADELFLTNLMQSSYSTTDGRVISNQDAVGITVGAPELLLTKGVASISNSNATIEPSPIENPADSNGVNADARDTVNYQITVENIGTQSAFFVTISDPNVEGLSCDQSSITVVNGNGANLGFSGDLQNGLILADPLSANDENPAGGGFPYGTDTAIVNVDCELAASVYPLQVVTNIAAVTWTSTNDPGDTPFTPVTDDASVTIAAPQITKTIIDSVPGYSGNDSKLHIGEVLTYQVEVTVPEGTSPNVRFEDLLDAGLAHIGTQSITLPAGVTSDVALPSNEGILASGTGVEADDRLLVFGPGEKDDGFGNITNSNNSNDVPEVITIVYTARVLNSTLNVNSTSLRNRARWYWKPDGGSRQNVQVKADRVIVIEPDIRITKNFMPNIGDNTTEPLVTITFEHTGASTADAFDLTLIEPLPKDMGILGGDAGVTVSGGCAPPQNITVSRTISDLLTIEWDDFEMADGVCEISFQTEFLIPQVPAGAEFNNCVAVFWQSLSDFDQPLPTPPNSTIAAERTGDTTGIGGSANTYDAEACDIFRIYDVGIAKLVESSSQSHTDNNPGTPLGTEALAIGEIVTFDLDVTLPLAPTLDLVVSDLLPRTEMVLELLDIEHIFLGADLTPAIFPPNKTITDGNGDGIADTGELDYGRVTHVLEPPVIDNDDRIKVRVTAKVLDVPQNSNERVDTNSAIVRFKPDTSAADDYPLELVEAAMAIDKLGSTSRVDAGDIIDYRIIISHASGSRTDAQDLRLVDTLPAELSLVAGTLKVGDACSIAPDSGPEVIGLKTITAAWNSFPLGASCEIDFSATVSVAAITGDTIVNSGEINWNSLNAGEQPSDPDDRRYKLSDQWEVVVSLPGLEKAVTATSQLDTPFRTDSPINKLTIGEEVTFTLETTFPDGTTLDAKLQDVLPTNDVVLEFISSKIVAVGADLSITGASTIGEAAVACTPPADNCLNWILGTVTNTPDLREEPDSADQYVVELVARVLDDPLNSGLPGEDKNLTNVGQMITSGGTLTSTAQFDIVEPLLQLQKLTSNGSIEKTTKPGMVEQFTLIIQHQAQSTAAARSLEITDRLSPEMEWVSDATVDTTCPGLVLDQAPTAGSSGQIVFSFDRLTQLQGQCEITFDVKMSDALPSQGFFQNNARLIWESAPGSPESRSYLDDARAILLSFERATISKTVVSTSLPETDASMGDPDIIDVNIAEHIEYSVAIRFAEGTTSSVQVIDTFQSDANGELEFLGGDLFFLGDNIIIGSPAIPVISGNTITIDMGDVVNTANLNTDLNDTVIYKLQLRAPDVPRNEAGDILTNEVELQFRGIGNALETITASADVEIVEPELTLNKSFSALEDAVATIELTVGNTGSGPAFDLGISDDFDNNIWVPGSLNAVSIPAGFVLSETTSGNVTTVSIEPEASTTTPPPTEILQPGETATAVFAMTLQNNGQPGVTTIPNTAFLQGSSLPGGEAAARVYTVDASDTLLLPAMDLLKAWSGLSNPALPGQELTYTLTLQNTGDAPATNITITDTPDAIGEFLVGTVMTSVGTVIKGNTSGDVEIEIAVPSLAAGATATVTYNVNVPLPYPAGVLAPQELVNQALAVSAELPDIDSDDPTTPGVDDATVVPIAADPIMTVRKSDGLYRVMPGDTLAYTVIYANIGDQDATGVVLTETVPDNTTFDPSLSSAAWSCSSFNAGGICTIGPTELAGGGTSGTVQFVVTIDPGVPPQVPSITNEVLIEEDGVEFGGGSSQPSTDSDIDIDFLQAVPNLFVGKTDGRITVIPGQGYRYGIVYANTGDRAASGVVLSETIPEYTTFNSGLSSPGWVCDSNLAGAACTIDVGTVQARSGSAALFGLTTDFPAASGVDLILNTVVLEDDGGSLVGPIVKEGSDITPLIATPDLVVTKSSTAASVKVDDTVIYTINYRQEGNQDATGVVIREIVPRGTVYSAEGSSDWSCPDGSSAGTICRLNIGDFAAGASGRATFAVLVVEKNESGRVVNVVETNDNGINGADPTPGNNLDTLIIGFFEKIETIPTLPKVFLLALMLAIMGAGGWQLRRRGRSNTV